MKILFCKVSSMKYYKGACKQDIPSYGGKFVEQNGYGYEEFNFLPIQLENRQEPECFGFVEPKSHRGVRNTLHIEKIQGCTALSKEPYVDDVLVIWCAKRERGTTTVVGWYQHATVWRNLRERTVVMDNGTEKKGSIMYVHWHVTAFFCHMVNVIDIYGLFQLQVIQNPMDLGNLWYGIPQSQRHRIF